MGTIDFHTNPSLPHESVRSTRSFSSQQIRQFNTYSPAPHKVSYRMLQHSLFEKMWNSLIKSFFIKVTCRKDEFVWNWRICVALTDLLEVKDLRRTLLVWNWRVVLMCTYMRKTKYNIETRAILFHLIIIRYVFIDFPLVSKSLVYFYTREKQPIYQTSFMEFIHEIHWQAAGCKLEFIKFNI